MLRAVSLASLFIGLALAPGCRSDAEEGRADFDGVGGSGARGGTGGTAGTTGGSASGSSGSSGDAGQSGEAGTPSGGSSSGGTSSGDAGQSGEAGTPSGEAGQRDNGTPREKRYAHVEAVETSGSAGAFTFNVTVESADIDCTQFADWWEVVSEDGALIYRRILEHSHTDENGTSDPDAPGNTFTRSGGPVTISAAETVLVRAHLSVGGYNGRVMRGSVADGFAEATDIGADFAADLESSDPQPTSCAF